MTGYGAAWNVSDADAVDLVSATGATVPTRLETASGAGPDVDPGTSGLQTLELRIRGDRPDTAPNELRVTVVYGTTGGSTASLVCTGDSCGHTFSVGDEVRVGFYNWRDGVDGLTQDFAESSASVERLRACP